MSLLDIFKSKESLSSSGALRGKTDCHSHILHGVDDGISTLEDSLEALAFLETIGISELWCTPHIMEDFPNTTDSLKRRFDELRAAYKGNIKLHLAAEYMMDLLLEERIRQRDLLESANNMLLVETSTWNPSYNIYDIFQRLMKMGYIPLLAHPERYRFMEERDYERLHLMGVRFQLNLPSLIGFFGDTAKKKAEMLLAGGMYSCYGSDCHRVGVLKKQYETKNLKPSILKMLEKI